MKKPICSILILVAAFPLGSLAAQSRQEAWLSASAFDGTVFSYEYAAYDAKDDVKEERKVLCDYTTFGGNLVLKSIDIKIFITSDFTKSGNVIRKKGAMNVRNAIDSCLNRVPNLRKDLVVPVAVHLPSISAPSLVK